MDDDPVLVTSGLSQGLEEDGYVFEINIFRLEDEERWTLEVNRPGFTGGSELSMDGAHGTRRQSEPLFT